MDVSEHFNCYVSRKRGQLEENQSARDMIRKRRIGELIVNRRDAY